MLGWKRFYRAVKSHGCIDLIAVSFEKKNRNKANETWATKKTTNKSVFFFLTLVSVIRLLNDKDFLREVWIQIVDC